MMQIEVGNLYKTRSGKTARIICNNRKDPKRNASIIALVSNKDNTYEQIVQYNSQGKQINYAHEFDLIL